MAEDLQACAPRFDHRMLELALSLPTEYLFISIVGWRALPDSLMHYASHCLVEPPNRQTPPPAIDNDPNWHQLDVLAKDDY